MANRTPCGFSWLLGHITLLLEIHGLRPYPAIIGPFCQFSTSATPRPIPLFWAWGFHFVFQGPLEPPAITRAFSPTPLIMGPPAPKARPVPNHKWAHLSPSLAPVSTIPYWPKRNPGTRLATFHQWPLQTTRAHQLSSSKDFPKFRGRPLFHQCTPYQRIQSYSSLKKYNPCYFFILLETLKQTRSQARSQAVLTPTPRAPLDSTPAVPQLRAQYGRRSTIQEGRKRAKNIKFFIRSSLQIPRTFKGPGEDSEEEEEESDGTEGVPAPVGASQGT
ncbi:hypothetical protein O181_047755 [Austropuccinia psidii MF-1]|uniref:Uncharacterized protein n=1 Tax=Austropuccinia psidii MF-1 TaxID=1389203 RepID=A0A9Q3DVW7_9BASI|nr:hypothetical protein [Austropuccinia psidii MF-1]